MKDPKHYLHPDFQNPTSAWILCKSLADIERAQIDAYNQALEDAAEKTQLFSTCGYSGLIIDKQSILALKKSVSRTD